MNILQINSSIRREGANSTRVADAIVAKLRAFDPNACVTVRDFALTPHPVLDADALTALFTPAEQRTPAQSARVALDDALIAAHGENPKLMPYLHLPVQSGSDLILKKMNRGHTVAFYLGLIARVRSVRPDIAISGDFIVGFPGETEEDFLATLDIVRAVGYACRTHKQSNTAFRGFGGPQGVVVMEDAIERIAGRLGKSADKIRALNFYRLGQETPYGQTVEEDHLPRVWAEVKKLGETDRRRSEIAAFNLRSPVLKRGLGLFPLKVEEPGAPAQGEQQHQKCRR